MIEEIHIHDLGVITDAVLPLGPGLSILSGETGAGKTMVVTALGMLRQGDTPGTVVQCPPSTTAGRRSPASWTPAGRSVSST